MATANSLDGYAASKGYDVLAAINVGEGFWDNAITAFTVQLPAGTAITTGDNLTPSFFNRGLTVIQPALNVIPQNITTLWAWDTVNLLFK